MATKTLNYCSCKELDCGFFPVEAKLCVNPAIVLSPTSQNAAFIDATLTQVTQCCINGRNSWSYTITYDDSQLVNNLTLRQADIKSVFCNQCLFDYIVSTISELCSSCLLEFENTPSINIESCGDLYQTIKANVNISDGTGAAAVAPGENLLQLLVDGLYVSLTPYTGNYTIVAGTTDGADTANFTISGGGGTPDATRGGFITVYGNESIGIPGGVNIGLGSIANSSVDLGYGGSATSHVRSYAGTTLEFQTTVGFAVEFKESTNESTGAGNAAFGAGNCPAVTATAVFKWLKVKLADGSTGYIPVWK